MQDVAEKALIALINHDADWVVCMMEVKQAR